MEFCIKMMEQILKEMEEHNKNGKESFLNNFHHKLPDERYDRGGVYRSYFEDEEWDTPFRILNGESPARPSELYLDQTPAEFFSTIDSAIEDCGIDLERLKTLQADKWNIKEIHSFVLPIYVRLREMGYKHYPDLTV